MRCLSRPTILLCTILASCSQPIFGQEEPSSALYKVLRVKDSLLFDVGFNTCNLSQVQQVLSDSFEFYHDEAGITPSKTEFINRMNDGICKLPYKARRELVKNSVEVYPLTRNGILYGAIQSGVHRFYAQEESRHEYLTSTAKFTHLWLIENYDWHLSRGFSYDHNAPARDSLLFKDKKETDKWLAERKIPAVGIGYIEAGKLVQRVVYGRDAQGKGLPANTIFNVASLTKPVTAMVALKLVNAGKWTLDEPLHKYWTDPDITTDLRSKLLTTRHVLSHRTGFPNWRYQTNDTLVFQFTPGTQYQYSGEGYEYLRKALEKKFNKTLNQLAAELIFLPLQMKDTRFYWDGTIDTSRFAEWHKQDGSKYETYKNISANAADDLLTTIEDYSKFMRHVMDGAGLNENLHEEMVSIQSPIKSRQHFGLGWMVDEQVNGEQNALTHGGDDKGVHTIVFMLPESKKGLLIFTNSDNGTEIYLPAIKHFLGAPGEQIIDIETK